MILKLQNFLRRKNTIARQPNRFGGGARTNANELHFEQTTSLDSALEEAGYEVRNHNVYKNGINIGMSVPQSQLYKYFLAPNGINYKVYNSKEWHPDEAFINYENSTVYIIEKKFQNKAGSVDEKLPSCDFKKWEYSKLFLPLNFDSFYNVHDEINTNSFEYLFESMDIDDYSELIQFASEYRVSFIFDEYKKIFHFWNQSCNIRFLSRCAWRNIL